MKYALSIMFFVPEPSEAGEIGAQLEALDLQQRIVKVLAMHDIDIVIAGRHAQQLPFEVSTEWWRASVEAAREENHA